MDAFVCIQHTGYSYRDITIEEVSHPVLSRSLFDPLFETCRRKHVLGLNAEPIRGRFQIMIIGVIAGCQYFRWQGARLNDRLAEFAFGIDHHTLPYSPKSSQAGILVVLDMIEEWQQDFWERLLFINKIVQLIILNSSRCMQKDMLPIGVQFTTAKRMRGIEIIL